MPSYEDVISALLTATHRLHPERIVALLASCLSQLSMTDMVLYLADSEQRVLVPLDGDGPNRPPLSIDDSAAGRAFRTETAVETPLTAPPEPGAVRLWAPVVDGAERLGVLAVTAVPGERLRRRLHDVATIAATLVVAKLPYGDALVVACRRRPMDLAAELRWDSLPPLTHVNDQIEISGRLEPAYEIAGDAFDYAINGDLAHIAIFDAMGHGLDASRTADLAVAAYRNARRRGGSPEQLFAFVDETARRVLDAGGYLTGQIAELDLGTGRLLLLNAGHPPPILVREGTASDVSLVPRLPFGLGSALTDRAAGPGAAELSLHPGDVVLLFTDGVTEARSLSGEVFGRDRLVQMLLDTMVEGPIAETARRLCHAVLDHQKGRLQDDATLVLVRWTGPAATGPARSATSR
ncbi:MAG: protein serine/threonine phosphatase [Acidimicrobiaceae bacterium]|nr:protein serine/threonine phosphatase [Acidimicrobiaceae bacterium]